MGYSQNSIRANSGRRATPATFPTSREEALAILGSRDSRKLANNTFLLRDDGKGNPALRLHSTNVVTFHPDGLTLNSGGWRTVVTKDRISACLSHGWSLDQDGGLWSLYHPAHPSMIPYGEGMTVATAERGITYEYDPDREPNPAAEKKLRKAVSDYAKRYVAALMAGRIGEPSMGDCWGCALVAEGSTPESRRADHPSKGLGGADHFLSHLAENYYVPSLAFRALESVNAGEGIFAAVAAKMRGESAGWAESFLPATLRRALTRYLRLALGLCR